MIIRQFKDQDVSLYGMGCMRLPKLGDGSDDGAIDEAATFEMVDYAYENGVNYYDVAYGYHNGNSEKVIGRALARYPRDSFMVATKFPGYDGNNWGKHEAIFAEQLERLQMDYVDMYLIHNVCEMNVDAYLNTEKYGDVEYFIGLRDAGEKIKHLGFSVHGNIDTMRKFLEKYGDQMEFVQIQLNYIDYEFQDAKAKLELAAQYNLPVIVMEPLRGGSLAKATEEETAKLTAQRPGEGIVAWAERYLQGFDQVFTILNGASSFEQMKENMGYFEDEAPLTDDDKAVLAAIVKERITNGIVPCTACKYCVSHCPQEINIPWMLELFNEHKFTGGGFIAPMALAVVPAGQKPGDCIGCGACAAVCPQTIDIPTELAAFAAML